MRDKYVRWKIELVMELYSTSASGELSPDTPEDWDWYEMLDLEHGERVCSCKATLIDEERR